MKIALAILWLSALPVQAENKSITVDASCTPGATYTKYVMTTFADGRVILTCVKTSIVPSKVVPKKAPAPVPATKKC